MSSVNSINSPINPNDPYLIQQQQIEQDELTEEQLSGDITSKENKDSEEAVQDKGVPSKGFWEQEGLKRKRPKGANCGNGRVAYTGGGTPPVNSQHGATGPGVTGPGVTGPGVTGPGVTGPGVAGGTVPTPGNITPITQKGGGCGSGGTVGPTGPIATKA